MTFSSIGKKTPYTPLTLDELDKMPGLHHSRVKKKRVKNGTSETPQSKTSEGTDSKVQEAVKKRKAESAELEERVSKICLTCKKSYSVKFKNPERAKMDYICKKCLGVSQVK